MNNPPTQSAGTSTGAVVEPKPDKRSTLRRITDGIYRGIARSTAATDPPTPRAEPTESQKFRGNLLITFVGSVVFVYGMQIIGDMAKQSQIAAERSNAQLQFFHDELKHFSENMPRVMLKTYQMNLARAQYIAATQAVPAGSAPAGSQVSAETLYNDFRKLQDEHTQLPNGEALCHQLSLYLQDQRAIDAIEALRKAQGRLFDANTIADVTKALNEANLAWDAAMVALGAEGKRLREELPYRGRTATPARLPSGTTPAVQPQ